MNVPTHTQTIVLVNTFLLGFSCAIGMSVPKWVKCLTYAVNALISMLLVHFVLRNG